MSRGFEVVVAALVLLVACSSNSPDFIVSQFTVSGDYNGEEWDMVAHERILNYSGRGLEGLGCTITPPNEHEYEYTVVHYLPGIPLTVGEGWAEPYVPSDAPNGMRTKPKLASGEKRLTWGISPGDPNGIYRIEIHINGRHTYTLEFEVRNVPAAQQAAEADGRTR